MLLAVPGKVVELKKGKVTVELFGSRQDVSCVLTDVKRGDYVLVQQGIIVEKLPEYEAQAIISEWDQYNSESDQAN